ncbi:MAG: serine hydrolase [Myxococcales bacterium]|nr:serine hydrolase [Myxococcales bacterium]
MAPSRAASSRSATRRARSGARASGALDRERADAPTRRTLYDLASVTKVVSVSLVVMSLVEGGALPARRRGGRAHPRVRGARQARAPRVATRRDDRAPADAQRRPPGLAPALRVGRRLRRRRPRGRTRAPLERRPGARTLYSDLDFILLSAKLVRARDRALARRAARAGRECSRRSGSATRGAAR